MTDPSSGSFEPSVPPSRPAAAEAVRAGEALTALAERIWDDHMAVHPVLATALGDRRFDDRLRPNGPGAVEADIARLRAAREDVLALRTENLSDADLVTHGELIDFLDRELDVVESGLHTWNVDPLDGPQVAYLDVPSFQPIR